MKGMEKRERPQMGRPPGPPEGVRRNRVTFTLTDGDLAKLGRLADERGLPLGTVAFEIISKTLRRAKR